MFSNQKTIQSMPNPSEIPVDTLPLQSFLEAATEAAQIGGQELVSRMGTAKVREKGKRDFVTEADLASQKAIGLHLENAFPEHRFLGEEDDPALNHSVLPKNDSESPFCWVVDPLDGTTNYVHQLPSFSVSIGLLYLGQPIVAVVWDPILKELYQATLGGGATRNGQSISVSNCDSIERAMVIISLAKGVTRADAQVQQLIELLETAGTIRRLGSAALNLCYVASGCSDSYWANNLKVWDVAAGYLIAAEAGAVLKQQSGEPVDLLKPDLICCATEKLFGQLRDTLTLTKD